jgi:hypothetical protein
MRSGTCATDGRNRATIWQNSDVRFTWHTWNDRGTGGENSEAASLDDTKRHCVAAIVRQGTWRMGGELVITIRGRASRSPLARDQRYTHHAGEIFDLETFV